MKQEQVLKILSGATKIAKASSQAIVDSSADFVEQNILKGKYVSREEYDTLYQLVLALNDRVQHLESINRAMQEEI